MHPAFREGFEKTSSLSKHAWWGPGGIGSSQHGPISQAKRLMQRGKTVGKDMLSGMGIGKGVMPKAFGIMTGMDVLSKTREAMSHSRGLTGIPASFGG